MHAREQVKFAYRVEGNSVVLFVWRRRMFNPDEWHENFVAKLVYIVSRNCWKLFDLNVHLKWRTHWVLPEAATFK